MGSLDATRLTLLQRAAQGGDAAWAEMDELYRPFVSRWFKGQGITNDSEDLTQEIMASLFHEMPRFEHNQRVGAFRNWLRTACLHRLLNYRRALHRRGAKAVGGTDFHDQLNEIGKSDDHAESAWDREHDQAVLAHLFAKLSSEFDSKTMTAFRGLTLEERQPAEVADELGMSVGALYVAKSRVLRRLRDEASDLLEKVAAG